eukprot:12896069-Prorocentrum_lima.AAC.1
MLKGHDGSYQGAVEDGALHELYNAFNIPTFLNKVSMSPSMTSSFHQDQFMNKASMTPSTISSHHPQGPEQRH